MKKSYQLPSGLIRSREGPWRRSTDVGDPNDVARLLQEPLSNEAERPKHNFFLKKSLGHGHDDLRGHSNNTGKCHQMTHEGRESVSQSVT